MIELGDEERVREFLFDKQFEEVLRKRAQQDPRSLLSNADFNIHSWIAQPDSDEFLPSIDMPASSFGSISFVDLLRTNESVTIIKDNGTALRYSADLPKREDD